MYPKIKLTTKEEIKKMMQEEQNKLINKAAGAPYILPAKKRESYYSNDRKKIQRVMNYYVKQVNRAIEKDYLWRGRFFIRQVGATCFYRFEDGSGAELTVCLRVYDKKTEKYVDSIDTVSGFCFFNGSKVFRLMNEAIVKHFDVWNYDKDDPNSPYNDLAVYNSIPDEYTIQNASPIYKEGVYINA